jgi:hypothetical protein
MPHDVHVKSDVRRRQPHAGGDGVSSSDGPPHSPGRSGPVGLVGAGFGKRGGSSSLGANLLAVLQMGTRPCRRRIWRLDHGGVRVLIVVEGAFLRLPSHFLDSGHVAHACPRGPGPGGPAGGAVAELHEQLAVLDGRSCPHTDVAAQPLGVLVDALETGATRGPRAGVAAAGGAPVLRLGSGPTTSVSITPSAELMAAAVAVISPLQMVRIRRAGEARGTGSFLSGSVGSRWPTW